MRYLIVVLRGGISILWTISVQDGSIWPKEPLITNDVRYGYGITILDIRLLVIYNISFRIYLLVVWFQTLNVTLAYLPRVVVFLIR